MAKNEKLVMYLKSHPVCKTTLEAEHDWLNSIYIRTVSSSCLFSTLLIQFNYFMGRLGRATCTVHLISSPGEPGRKQMYHYNIRKANIYTVDAGNRHRGRYTVVRPAL